MRKEDGRKMEGHGEDPARGKVWRSDKGCLRKTQLLGLKTVVAVPEMRPSRDTKRLSRTQESDQASEGGKESQEQGPER